jgi:hypothetical protein
MWTVLRAQKDSLTGELVAGTIIKKEDNFVISGNAVLRFEAIEHLRSEILRTYLLTELSPS